MTPSLRGTVALLAAAALVGCASTPSGEPDGGPGDDGEADGERAEAPETPLTPAQEAALRVESVEFRPSSVELDVGESATVEVVALDSAGSPVEGVQIGRGAEGAAVDFDASTGTVTGEEPGEATLLAMVQRPARDGGEPERIVARADVEVNP
ncbi:MAG: hypothetical protein ACOC5E_01990, partial [Acidobacteriota bacterium]